MCTSWDVLTQNKIILLSKLINMILNSSTIDELESWCLKVGEEGKWASELKEVSMATLQATTIKGTVPLIQCLELLPTQYLPELGHEGMKSSQYSYQCGHATCQQASEHKATMRNFLPNSGLPPNKPEGT